MSVEVIQGKLTSLDIVLPPVSVPQANYVPYVIAGNLLFLSGQGPKAAVTVDEAYQHARLTGIRMLSVIESALGSLDRVNGVVKVLGFVNSVPTFGGHPKVINGCSDLMVEVFGEIGRHARSAVGVSSLPENSTVEIEGIFEIQQS